MNAITEGKEHELAPDANGEIIKLATSASIDLSLEILDSSALKESGRGAEARERSSIESRTELRIAATNEAMRADPDRTESAIKIAEHVAKAWVDLDATDFPRIRSEDRREFALDAIATHAATSPEYAKELKERSPSLAQAAENINLARAKVEQQLSVQQANVQRQAAMDEQSKKRQEAIDAASLENLASVRATELARVIELLSQSPLSNDRGLNVGVEAAQTLLADVTTGQTPAPQRSEKAIKRPLDDSELSASLQDRFIVSHEKRGLWDKGSTEFTFRRGDNQGKLAFVDSGKSLTTAGDDRETIRAMLEVAKTKNWKEVTLTGSDDFKRNAWIEASLNGLEVRGYEPREADKLLLQDLQADRKPLNAIVSVDRPEVAHRVAQGKSKQIDGDELPVSAQSVVESSRAFLLSKDLGATFADATMRHLMSKFRTHEGEIVEHGHAPYKFDQNNEPSYFVALKTPSGEQVIWGKGLADAMQERKAGEQVVLQNNGKKDALVNEKVRDAAGHVVSSRPKESKLNQWTVEVAGRATAKLKESQMPDGRQASFRVYDSKAPRKPSTQRRDVGQTAKHSSELKPPARER